MSATDLWTRGTHSGAIYDKDRTIHFSLSWHRVSSAGAWWARTTIGPSFKLQPSTAI